MPCPEGTRIPESMYVSKPRSPGSPGITNSIDGGVQQATADQVTELLALSIEMVSMENISIRLCR